MRDIAGELRGWIDAGTPFAVAILVAVTDSAPRLPGAAMAYGADGRVVGSVAGGCVEGAVVEAMTEVMRTGIPRVVTYGYSDEQAFAVGLTCGGAVQLVLVPADPPRIDVLARVIQCIETADSVSLAIAVSGPGADAQLLAITTGDVSGGLGSEGLDVAVTDDARTMLADGETGLRHYGANGERRSHDVTIFVESFAPRPRMIVFGAIDFSAAVAEMGRFLGYHVTVCDARSAFATPQRFPKADEVVVERPHRYLAATPVDARTVICVLTHDPKFDVPLLEVALRTSAAYIGVMGSRRTHDHRLASLRELGLADEALARLRSPIGLDLGGRSPAETAVSIGAEIVALQWGGTGRPLSQTAGPIHSDRRGVRDRVGTAG